jgi:predicted nucleotidyltransferase component of viral defense system
MKILATGAFRDNLKPFGIAAIAPPDIAKAKQTETTQRFKIHLILHSGEDLFTKIEFSRRGFAGNTLVEAIDNAVLRTYKLAPVLIPHYDVSAAVRQKIRALAGRAAVQARDIFDLYLLSSQYSAGGRPIQDSDAVYSKACERIFEVEFGKFRDTVVAYLSADDQAAYGQAQVWEEICLKTADFIEELRKSHA